MTPKDLQKIRNKNMILEEVFRTFVRAKNKQEDIYYSRRGGEIVKRTPSGQITIVEKKTKKVANTIR